MSAGPFGCVQALGRHKQLWPISKSGFDSPIIDVSISDSVITSVVEYSATLVYVSTDKGQIFEVNVKTQQVSPIIHIANEVTPLVFSPVVDPKHGPVLQQPLLLHRLRPGLPSDAAHQARKFPRFLAPSLRAAAAAAAASFRGFLTAAAGRALSRGESRVAAEPPHLPVAALSRSPAELPPPLSWLVPCSLPTCRTIGWSSSRGDTCRSGTSTTRRVPSTLYRLTTPSPCVSLILSPIPSCRAK